MRKDASFPPPSRPAGSRRHQLSRRFAAALRAAPARVGGLARLAMPPLRAMPAALLAGMALLAMPALRATPAVLLAGAALLGAPALLAAPAGTAAAPAPAVTGLAGAHPRSGAPASIQAGGQASSQAGAPASIQAGAPAPVGPSAPSQTPPAPGDSVLDVTLPGTAPRQLAAPASRSATPAPPAQQPPRLPAPVSTPCVRGHGTELTLAALAGALAMLGGWFAWQKRPRRCPRCGQAMRRLEGAAAFAELDMAERTEHLIGEVRYRVWRCAACAEVAKEGDLRAVSNAVAAAAGPAGSSAFLRRQAHSGLSILPRRHIPPHPPDPGHPGEIADPANPGHPGETADPADPAEIGEP